MLKASQFQVIHGDHGPPLVFVAEKRIAVHRAG